MSLQPHLIYVVHTGAVAALPVKGTQLAIKLAFVDNN